MFPVFLFDEPDVDVVTPALLLIVVGVFHGSEAVKLIDDEE